MRNKDDEKTSIYFFKCAEYIVCSNQLQPWQLWKYSYEHNRNCGMFDSSERRKKMTESEAIKELQENIDLPFGSNVSKEVAKMAIQALEKQIPKKPIKSEKQVIRYVNTYYCPICKLGFTGTGIAKWCYHCGQKLDWSDEDDR